MKYLYVINSNGEKRKFYLQKVYSSARRAGASRKLAREVAKAIEKEAYSGITTFEIFKRIKKLLRQESPKAALRFNLKEGMSKLGPSGFPFEKFIGEVFSKLGFSVKINQHLPGKCLADYEIDFLAEKNNLVYVGECKYRNFTRERIKSKEALANSARFMDILNGAYFKEKKYKNYKIETMMVTNTKFTTRAMKYSRCMNMDLLGWNCPKNEGLEFLIEQQKLYPITILPSLKGKYLLDIFASEKKMLVKDILKLNPQVFSKRFNVPIQKIQSLIREAKILLEQ